MRRHNLPISAIGISIPVIAALFVMSLSCQPLLAQTPFASYNVFVSTGPTTADVVFVEGPLSPAYGLPSLTDPPLPGWDANAVAMDSVGPIPPPTLDDSTLVLTIPINDTITYNARDTEGNDLGQLSILATGTQKLDLNAGSAMVDEDAGTIQVTVGPHVMGYQPVSFSVLEETGMYASDVRVLEDSLLGYAGGFFLLPQDDDPNTSLQENILTAWEAGQIIGADLAGVISGQYVPEPSTISLAALGLFAGACVLLRKGAMP